MEFVEMFYTCMIPKYFDFDFNQEKRVNRNISVENMRMEDVFLLIDFEQIDFINHPAYIMVTIF